MRYHVVCRGGYLGEVDADELSLIMLLWPSNTEKTHGYPSEELSFIPDDLREPIRSWADVEAAFGGYVMPGERD